MKNKNIIYVFLLTMFMFSCEKQKKDPVLELVKGPKFSEPVSGGTFILLDENKDDVFTTLKWEKAEYNLPIEISYTVEIDIKENNFSDPIVLGTTNADSLQIIVFDINKILTTKMGLFPGTTYDISFRVGSHGAKSEKKYSNPIDLNVTPYNPPFVPSKLYVISGGTKIGEINPTNEEGKYEGYVWFRSSNLEFTFSENENGDNPIGDDDGNNSLEFGGENIVVAEEGHYKINVNSYEMAYTISEQAWGIIGSAVDPYNWSADINMAYLVDEGVWQISTDTIANPIIDGQFKFRPNDSWDPLNYGDDGADGIPDEYGANINISAGNYVITLDLREYPYSYSVVEITK